MSKLSLFFVQMSKIVQVLCPRLSMWQHCLQLGVQVALFFIKVLFYLVPASLHILLLYTSPLVFPSLSIPRANKFTYGNPGLCPRGVGPPTLRSAVPYQYGLTGSIFFWYIFLWSFFLIWKPLCYRRFLSDYLLIWASCDPCGYVTRLILAVILCPKLEVGHPCRSFILVIFLSGSSKKSP